MHSQLLLPPRAMGINGLISAELNLTIHRCLKTGLRNTSHKLPISMALANFISTRILASTLFVVQPLYATNEDTPNSPPVSAKPLKMMSRLSGLIGKWQMQTIYSADQGQHWQDLGTVSVDIGYDQRKLMIYERPIQPNKTGFNMVSFITYDQYRNVFRKAAIDDVWGIMDLYKGEVKDDKLVLTNLDTGTLFPEPDGLLRGFRISLELEGDRRTMVIESTLDKGKTWHPNFKNIYTREIELNKPL